MNAYLDIDGVLLTKKGQIPEGALQFIEFLMGRFDCYWLTTHCRHGQNRAVDYLAKYYPAEVIRKLERTIPTDWDALKTEAIDFSQPFWWFEDAPFEAELEHLRAMELEDRCVRVNLDRPNELKRIAENFKL